MSPPGGMRARPPETGAATVWCIGLMTVIWFTAIAVALVASVRAVRHQAGAAADLAALAAAKQTGQGEVRACRAAGRVANTNGGRLDGCVVDGRVAEVRVEVPLPSVFGALALPDGVMMRSRAGPVRGEWARPQSEGTPHAPR